MLKGELKSTRTDGSPGTRDESTKAMDVVAARPSSPLLLIEIKDFRSTGDGKRSVAFNGRWKELPLEIALKVRDTLAGVYGVIHIGTATDAAWLRAALCDGVRIVALIPQDAKRAGETDGKRKIRDAEMLKNLQRRLAWLTRLEHQISVIDDLRTTLPPWLRGLTITST